MNAQRVQTRPYGPVPSRSFLIACVSLAILSLGWNVFAILLGWTPGYLRVLLDTGVLVVLFTKSRYARIYIKVWSFLPTVSVCLFLVSSALRGRWSAYPIEHIAGLVVTLPIFLWADKAFRVTGEV